MTLREAIKYHKELESLEHSLATSGQILPPAVFSHAQLCKWLEELQQLRKLKREVKKLGLDIDGS